MPLLPSNIVPISYELDEKNNILHLSWSDAHESIFGYERLRRACPCAWCAGEGNFQGNLTPETVLSGEEIILYEIQPVGRYGLTPVWGDGHRTGIYTLEKLRALCECDECLTDRGKPLK